MLARGLLIAWVALLGADRVDLLGGRGPALLLPLHVLTPLVVVTEWRRRLLAQRLPQFTGEAAAFAALVLALLAIVALSIVRSGDVTMSLGRALLFGGTAVGVPLALWGAADRADLLSILGRGAAWGLSIALVFNLLALGVLFDLVPRDVTVGPASAHLATAIYGAVPRLAGATSDMNRGGLVALIHTVLIVLARPPMRGRSGWMALGALLTLGSLSRSVMLCAIPTLLLTPRLRSAMRGSRLLLAVLLGALALGTATLLHPRVREQTVRATAPLAERLRLREGSAQAHAFLFRRAGEVALRDIPGTLIGIGYGTSFRVLADFFAGNPYGNFHSTWFTLWVESGIVAMLVMLALLVLPLRRAGPLNGLLIGLVAYNAFYNGFTEPLLWATLTLVWLVPQVWDRLNPNVAT